MAESEAKTAAGAISPADVQKMIDAAIARDRADRPAPLDGDAIGKMIAEGIAKHHAEAEGAAKAAAAENDAAADRQRKADARQAEEDAKAQAKADDVKRKADARADEQRREAAASAYRSALTRTPGDIHAAKELGGVLRFADGTTFLSDQGTRAIAGSEMSMLNGRIVIDKVLTFDAQGARATVSEAWLELETGAMAKCDVPGGLQVGGGAEAQLPAGHLAFG